MSNKRSEIILSPIRCFPLLIFSFIFALFSKSSSAQSCGNGSYQAIIDETTSSYTDETTGSPHLVATTPYCIPCNSTITFCHICHVHSNSSSATVICDVCFEGYKATDNGRNCALATRDNTAGIIIGVVVPVVLLVVAGLVILIVWLNRNGYCPPSFLGNQPVPPSLPDPEHLSSSFKDNQQSGSGQGRTRYTKEPGPTFPRVESVQYEGVNGIEMQDQGSTYVNVSEVSTTKTKEKRQKGEEGKGQGHSNEVDDDDNIYVNSPSTPASKASVAARPSKENPSAGRKGPGPARPKPQTKPKSTGVHEGTGVSVIPLVDSPEQVYSNQPDSENEEDYVNAGVTQPKRN